MTAATSRPRTVTVVGGGAVGLAVARSLADADVEVTVLERRRVGSGASHGNAGWIVPTLSAPLPGPGMALTGLRSMVDRDGAFRMAPPAHPSQLAWLYRFWRAGTAARHDAGLRATARLAGDAFELLDELVADGLDFEMHRQGLLFAFLDPRGAQTHLDHIRPLIDQGHAAAPRVMTGEEARGFEPALGDGVGSAMQVEQERHVDPSALCKALAADLRRHGQRVEEGVEVTGVITRAGRVTGLHTSAGIARSDAVVLAGGAWTTTLTRPLGIPLPMQPGTGYSMTASLPVTPSRPLYLGEAKVAVSPFDGGVRIAGTMELRGMDERIDPRRIQALLRGTRRFLSSWDASGLSEPWAGMRPVTADGLPAIGPVAGYDNLHLATGHAMLGITLALSTGRALAQGIVSGRMPAVLHPFSPTRF